MGICHPASKPRTPEDFVSIVCAEIPDRDQFLELYNVITTFMMHGPCGTSNPKSPCMEDDKCTKKFPKEFVEKTFAGDGYPHYRRRNDGKSITKNSISLDNRWVVPYNPYLSKKCNAHTNVEICTSIKSCKYLYKYVYKGPYIASVAIELQDVSQQENPKEIDEINKYVKSRFMTASEGYWRIMGFDVHGREPSIQQFAVHEENLHMITFTADSPDEPLTNLKDTTLLAWFKLNQTGSSARNFKYHEISEKYVGIKGQHKWTHRKQGRCIGCVYTSNQSQGE